MQSERTMTAKALIGEEDRLRADLYALLANLLSSPPDRVTLKGIAGLEGDRSALGQAISALAQTAKASDARAVEIEYNALFIGLARGELLPFASYYLTGFLNEKPLAKLRQDMARLGIGKSKANSEPEDHIATLCEMMAGLIRGDFAAPICLSVQREFYDTHLAPWAAHFFADLEGAKGAAFFAPVGRIGRAFLDIEDQAFRMEG